MQDLLIRVIAEGHMIQPDILRAERYRRRTVLLFFAVQEGVNFTYDGPDLCQTVHEIHGGKQRAGNAEGEDDDSNKSLDIQRAAQIHDPAHGKNSDQCCGRQRP